jgi:hypothetical protein
MINEQELEAEYTNVEYQEYVDELNKDLEATADRYDAWIMPNLADLKRIYCRRVTDDDEEACNLSFIEWCRQMFISYEYNTKKKTAIENEMKEMLGEN